MRKLLFVVFLALSLISVARPVRADSFFHLPCDPDAGLSISGGVFRGRTHASGVGNITFQRLMIGMPRLELTILENCGRNDLDRPRVTRWWLGRVNVFGSLVPEQAHLTLDNRKGSTGNKNTLAQASIDGGLSYSYNLGARASLVDATHFHVEAYYEQTGTFGWNEAEPESVIAKVNGFELDVTSLVQEHARVVYRFTSRSYGLTIGVPINKSNTTSRRRVTPFVTFGRMQIEADVEARVNPDFVSTLRTLGVDPDDVAKRRGVSKSSWSGNGGARLDLNRNLSFEASLAYGKTESTAIYVGMLTMTLRFGLPSLRDLGRTTLPPFTTPF